MFELAINFPNISPEIIGFDIGDRRFALRWYSLAYMVGLFAGWKILMRITSRDDYPHKNIRPEIVDDFLLYAIAGIIIGGRIFGTLVYNWDYYSRHLIEVILPPYAGMSFHGGFLGIIVATLFVAKKHNISVRAFGDLLALVAPIGLFFGRISNFINAELWGHETDVAWGVIFPGEAVARHPSQLYEAGLEGLLLGLILFAFYRNGALLKRGLLIGIFFLGYGLSRIFVEFFRNADAQFITAENPFGHVISLGNFGLTMGQTLSLPMVFIGLAFIWYARKNP